jgi:hypothetical protein
VTQLLGVVAVIALLAFVVWLVSAPLRRPRATPDPYDSDERRGFEAARDAKYAEIRDAELDYRTGKLSDDDYRALDRQLRAQAVDILRALDELR